ncbi:hypothetical protein E4M02_04205 [Brevundimonas sp. S30B]|uniref:hypothetical protein n=1 Tax=unclassified Brevundimonas TaxID=2622653 RepID=UPI001072DAF5|nr:MULTISPECIES: hypothetical protein [unclassified Brevundimonas]QBX36924.1 hypothetical protein E4M01_03610 [Brevundimonas sp. MF30-B]TFW04281.1 hypothetical protein E4M02_04205 [Brevundimonas sp. S30B]
MHRFLTMKRLSILFAGVFGVMMIGLFAYQSVWAAPGERCEKSGRWWHMESRTCAQPISIAEITRRPIGVSRAEASAEKNRELVAIERQLAARDAAIAADADRQRVALAAAEGR